MGEQPKTALAIFCKDCGGVFFVMVNEPRHVAEDAYDIAAHLKEGHALHEISLEAARAATWCECPTAEAVNAH